MPVNAITPIKNEPLQQKKNHNHINLKTTGYTSMGLFAASGFLAMNKKTMKSHKYFGWAGILVGAIHTGICLARPKKDTKKINI